MKKLWFTLLTMLLPLLVSAQENWLSPNETLATINGIGYLLRTGHFPDSDLDPDLRDYENEATVLNQGGGGYISYSGVIEIPSEVIYNGQKYPVLLIGNDSFGNCKDLTSVTIPNSVRRIAAWAFIDSGVTSVTISQGLKSIGQMAFYNCENLTSITIPNSVERIEESAFEGCGSLTSIVVENGNTFYDSRENCNAIIQKSNNELITGCMNTSIPNDVSSIGYGAFRGCCDLNSIVIPKSVTSIGDWAFVECSSLTSIVIPNSVTSIGERAFAGCNSLTSIVVEEGNCDYDSREGCNAIIKTNDNKLVLGCMYTSIPNGVTSIGANAFSGCSGLTSIIIPNSVTSIDERAFEGCSSLASFTIPNSVTSIGEYAFLNCSLATITIPNSVTSIGRSAFSCSNLSSVIVERTEPSTISEYAFNFNTNNTLYVPKGCVEKYKNANGWKKFKRILEIGTTGQGDANDDNKVNAADIVEVVNYMNGHPSKEFNFSAADMNNDGKIDKVDIDMIVKTIFSAQ